MRVSSSQITAIVGIRALEIGLDGDSATGGHRLSLGIVCVFCARDLEFLLMQARSVALYATAGSFGRVYLVWNDDIELSAVRTGEVLATLASLGVRMVHASNLGVTGPVRDGWVRQQALKLLAARVVEESHYLVLDAKNHFIRPVAALDFLCGDGRALQPVATLRGPSALSFRFCLDYLGTATEGRAPVAALNVTPFVFETALARDLIALVEEREDSSFDEALHSFSGHADRVTEFMLYQAFVVRQHGALDVFADNAKTAAETLWNYEVQQRRTADWIARVEADPGIKTAGVHWLACMNMDVPERRLVADFWLRCGLVSTQEQGVEIIESVVSGASDGDRAFAERQRASRGA